MSTPSRLVYIARGQLFVKVGDGAALPFESPFGRSIQDQKIATHKKRAWQQKSMMGGMPAHLAEQILNQEPPVPPVTVNSLCRGKDDTLFFALRTEAVSGFLSLDVARQHEQRLFHTADFGLDHLDYSPQFDMMACTLRGGGDTSHIAIFPSNGTRPTELTEGDALDLAPRWVPGPRQTLVFQSAGLARDAKGEIRERAPFSIEKLDVESGETTTLASDEKWDYLGPRLLEDGTLLCIRRPFKGGRGGGASAKAAFASALTLMLMPFYLLQALFVGMSFYIWRNTGRQVMTAGKNEKRDATVTAWDQVLSPQKMPRKKNGDAEQSWVPKEWQLASLAPGAQEWQPLADGVLSYDLASDGTLFWTNGGGVFKRTPDSQNERFHRDSAIEAILAC